MQKASVCNLKHSFDYKVLYKNELYHIGSLEIIESTFKMLEKGIKEWREVLKIDDELCFVTYLMAEKELKNEQISTIN